MKILVTGFEAFGNDAINPTEALLKQLPKEFKGASIDTVLLPVVGKQTDNILRTYLDRDYDCVISFGLAGGIDEIRVERVAINVDDYRIKDNAGNQPIDEPIERTGKNAYFSTLPIKRIVEKLNTDDYKASVSNSAGTYVCNHVMYEVLYILESTNKQTKAGFIHVPYLDIQDKKPSISLEKLTEVAITIISTCIAYDQDVKVSGGKEY
ncbi:pyroglutamyl-peptidase [Breznakia blatticola]|uniref:Pyrrolidone-carboxylate peptidase n=1 Tax=Breznakia blatticola TaxID=1754012 RepID=A0A4R8A9B3_9FIRM|nr:pyroglutamyl-peptidase I [Breznakia blatticola]TDW26291.1 pyroglutamyl-peptidase [Breznakia blatticola]